jgi:hypothetical protein
LQQQSQQVVALFKVGDDVGQFFHHDTTQRVHLLAGRVNRQQANLTIQLFEPKYVTRGDSIP